jgi:hypothetical protein
MRYQRHSPRHYRRRGGWRSDIDFNHTVAEAGLLSREATAAVASAFNTLTESVNKHEPSLEDVVRDTLRPMLKSWMDENLPRVVERMVETEVERVTRGR